MKKLLLILLMPIIGFGQCIKGDCENGVGLYFWPDGSYTNGSWKDGSPHGIIQKTDFHEGKLIKSFEGEMEMGLVNGWGIWIHKDGRIEKGTYKDGKLIN